MYTPTSVIELPLQSKQIEINCIDQDDDETKKTQFSINLLLTTMQNHRFFISSSFGAHPLIL